MLVARWQPADLARDLTVAAQGMLLFGACCVHPCQQGSHASSKGGLPHMRQPAGNPHATYCALQCNDLQRSVVPGSC